MQSPPQSIHFTEKQVDENPTNNMFSWTFFYSKSKKITIDASNLQYVFRKGLDEREKKKKTFNTSNLRGILYNINSTVFSHSAYILAFLTLWSA